MPQIIESHLRTEESVKSDDVDDAVMVAHLVWHICHGLGF